MAVVAASGKRWVEILRVLREELPGDWSIRGGGLRSILIREPIGWTIPWIGASKASSVRMHAGVAPALTPHLGWLMGEYGLDMSELRDPRLRALPLGDDGDLEIARQFVVPALARIAELTPQFYARRAEYVLGVVADGGPTSSTTHLMAPGWRVINGSGDPVAAARICQDWARWRLAGEPEYIPPYLDFYDGLIDAWHSGGRDHALAFLTWNRDHQLAEQRYDEPSP